MQKQKSSLHAVLVPHKGETRAAAGAGGAVARGWQDRRQVAALGRADAAQSGGAGLSDAWRSRGHRNGARRRARAAARRRAGRRALRGAGARRAPAPSLAVAPPQPVVRNERQSRESEPRSSGDHRARVGARPRALRRRRARFTSRTNTRSRARPRSGCRCRSDDPWQTVPRSARRRRAVGARLRSALGQRGGARARERGRDDHRPLRGDAQGARRRRVARDRRSRRRPATRRGWPPTRACRSTRACARSPPTSRPARRRRWPARAPRTTTCCRRCATTSRPAPGQGWGQGDIEWACDKRYGNCTDFHALFIGLLRASGIPARFSIGYAIPTGAGGDIPGYHCWADFYVDGVGWFPVDASEAWKHKDKARLLLRPSRRRSRAARDRARRAAAGRAWRARSTTSSTRTPKPPTARAVEVTRKTSYAP